MSLGVRLQVETAAAGEGELRGGHLHPPQADRAEDGAAMPGGVRDLLPFGFSGGTWRVFLAALPHFTLLYRLHDWFSIFIEKHSYLC